MSKLTPELIQSYLKRNLRESQTPAIGVRLKQAGEMRLGPQQPWFRFAATQTMSATRVEFRWKARFWMRGILPGTVEDRFVDGCGRLDAWLLGIFRVAHAVGPKVDRSEAQRYLAEIAWCPMAWNHNESLEFQTLGENRIRLSARDDQTYVDLQFNDDSEMIGVETTTRYRDQEPQP